MKEHAMTQQVNATRTRAGAFDSVAKADQAIRRLLAAGFSKDYLALVCPAKLRDQFRPAAPEADAPAADAGEAIAKGGALGATLGGLALAATVVTGGVAGAMIAVVLIGGGAFTGAFSNLITAKGYEQEADDHYRQAVEHGLIVVGVEVSGEDGAGRLAEAQRILDEAGAKPYLPK